MSSSNMSVKGHYVMCNQVILPRRGVNLLAPATAGKGTSSPQRHHEPHHRHIVLAGSRTGGAPERARPGVTGKTYLSRCLLAYHAPAVRAINVVEDEG
jgi:hypothetical protein